MGASACYQRGKIANMADYVDPREITAVRIGDYEFPVVIDPEATVMRVEYPKPPTERGFTGVEINRFAEKVRADIDEFDRMRDKARRYDEIVAILRPDLDPDSHQLELVREVIHRG